MVPSISNKEVAVSKRNSASTLLRWREVIECSQGRVEYHTTLARLSISLIPALGCYPLHVPAEFRSRLRSPKTTGTADASKIMPLGTGTGVVVGVPLKLPSPSPVPY